MTEKKIILNADSIKIEGLFNERPGKKAVVVTHPHPLYGGDMYNNVVESVAHAYVKNGYSTIRFNFRGVGASEGQYDEGVGEQEDVKSALNYLKSIGKGHVHLAGYSFGAWVNARILDNNKEPICVVMISPPVNFIDFSFLKYDPRIRLVIAGSKDEIAPPRFIIKMIDDWNPEAALYEIPDADHFYYGKTKEIERIIDDFVVQEEKKPGKVQEKS